VSGIIAKLHSPPPALTPHVSHIWELCGTWAQEDDLLLPDTSIDISIQIEGESEIRFANGWSRLPGRMVVGSLTHALALRHRGRFHAIGIRLPPGSAPLLRVPFAALRNIVCPLSEIAPSLDRSLAIMTSPLNDGAFNIESLWPALYQQVGRSHDELMQRAALHLTNTRGGSITALAEALGISRRHLSRRFGADIGWAPEEFRRLARFSAASAIAATTPLQKWCDIAVAAGYFDQAHFVRDFKSFVSLTPSTAFSASWYSNFAQ
jgi:AraC-like DNA-binding protein